MDSTLINSAELRQYLLKDKLDQIIKQAEPGSGKNISKEDKAGYAKAARGFESMFLHMMLKEMKESMLEDKENEERMSFGADTLEGYSNMLLSDQVSNTGAGVGIAEKIYYHMTGEHLPEIRVINGSADPKSKIPGKDSQQEAVQAQPKIMDYFKGNFSQRVNERLLKFEDIINNASETHDVPKELIKAVITAESAGNPSAVSSAGAKGLMQLMDGTARDLGVNNSFDPAQNIMAGTKYIRQMLDRFDGDLGLALAAYNSGPGNVQKYNGIPPFRETQAYVQRVKRYNYKYMADQTEIEEL